MSQLVVEMLNTCDQVDSMQDRWNQLAGNRSQLRWEWLGAWAKHYCRDEGVLLVLVVRKDGDVVGIAPLCIMDRPYFGRTICFLGSGKACTDHMTLLIEPEYEEAVVSAIANWLIENRSGDATWNHCQLIGVDGDDAIMLRFNEAMVDLGCYLDSRPGQPCYEVELPSEIDEYVSRRSKNGRRDCKKAARALGDGTYEVFTPQTRTELESYWSSFVSLHQMRREVMGDKGCFKHSRFEEFLWDASCGLLDAGLLQMPFVLFEGKPIAVHYSIVSEDRWLFYQSGMDPGYSKHGPGTLAMYHSISVSIQRSHAYFDMMRGGEAYKLRWRGEPVPTTETRIAAPQFFAQLTQRAWQWRKAAKAWTAKKHQREA